MKSRYWRFILIALAVSLLLAGLISPFASSDPDGLERVAEGKGFMERAPEEPKWRLAPMVDYVFPGIEDERVATALAGIVGTSFIFGLGFGLAWLLARRRNARQAETP